MTMTMTMTIAITITITIPFTITITNYSLLLLSLLLSLRIGAGGTPGCRMGDEKPIQMSLQASPIQQNDTALLYYTMIYHNKL